MFALGLRRFSDELDFTAEKQVAVEPLAREAVTDLNNLGIPSSYSKSKGKFSENTFKIRSEGPLYKTASSIVAVRLEVSKREEVLLPPDARNLESIYIDIPSFSYLMMQPSEILSEKVRAILTRLQARDLYDVNFLVGHGYSTNRKTIDSKLKYYGKTFDLELFKNRLFDISPLWKNEMETIVMGTLPDIDTVIDAIVKAADAWH